MGQKDERRRRPHSRKEAKPGGEGGGKGQGGGGGGGFKVEIKLKRRIEKEEEEFGTYTLSPWCCACYLQCTTFWL